MATDIAARGLDIANISHVINYDIPSTLPDAHIQRTGRAARNGKRAVKQKTKNLFDNRGRAHYHWD